MAEYKVVDAEQLDADLTEIADEVRILVDTLDEMSMEQMTANIAQANEDIVAQTDLIEQIKTALDGKASASGSEIIAQIAALIDESGVLDSTEGTVEEKVKQLVDKSEYENAWYIASKNINLLNNNSPFISTKFNYKTLPRIDCSNQTSLLYSFSSNSSLEYIDWYIDAPKCTTAANILSYCSNLKWIRGINLSNCSSVSEMFYSSPIERIELPLDVSAVTSVANMNIFKGHPNTIREVYFVKNCIRWSFPIGSPYLTEESIQSIIDGLAAVETAQTLTLHKDVKAKLTNDQLTTITNKNWTLA